jgi:hypothetical protein
MNSMMKLTAAALGALSIAGGVAVAQDNSTSDEDARSQTANYGTPPGAPLKRDGSLGADPKLTTTIGAPATVDTTSTTTSSTATTTTVAPAADTSSAAPATDTSTSAADVPPQPRADRN